jgi:hypothetical protein
VDTATLVDATAAPVHELGGAYYFSPEALRAAEKLGLDVFMLHCLGRGGVLGDVDADRVAAALPWYQPAVVHVQWDEARALVEPGTAARAYLEAARSYARRAFVETDEIRAFSDAAQQVVDAVPTGTYALIDGYRTFEMPDDAVGRAYQQVVILRELRDAAHADASSTLGLTATEAHVLASEDAFELYGHGSEAAPVVTDELVERLALAEDATTELLVASYDVLDAASSHDFLEGVRSLAAHADVAVEGVAD